ncbi:sugar ABC transporter ATP-binding protein [Jiella sonneratiae]|uniref:Sugar ABC transporter ATP-binding protein n=1 Tax=Jiella sonneratiae TaxID=2816856 RepID=A0ABS3J2F8_9HYPH|nr:sugar ABC transporter ATP-binding protein [Jiella sonneratiae]MBO0903845.1 sugar ABC transporter ATP-binding protein [Jiella sonneratiae]
MLLSMKRITKSFGPVAVLHGVDFEVKAGEIHALVGHNGAGKSTLMKTLGGNFTDYGGEIRIEDEPRALHAPAAALEAGVRMIYQDFSLAPNLTVAENIALGREPAGRLPGTIDHGRMRRRSFEEAEALGIKLPMERRVGSLGVAAQQLTEIVRACSTAPRILVMDEPTARLAPAERAQLFSIMRRMVRERGVGIVYISHFLDEVIEISDRITVLRDGRTIASGPKADYDVASLSALLVDRELEPQAAAERGRSGHAATVLAVKGLALPGLAPLDFHLDAGEILGLAGLVGSGRTRLARALVGDLESGGEVVVGGTALTRRDPKRAAEAGLVMVPEDRKVNGLAANSSIEANIAVTALNTELARNGIVDRRRRRALALDLIDRFAIRPRDPGRPVGTLSGGNAQKVLVARAVAAKPTVMILDQPTAGVDIGAKAELHAILKAAARDGAGILLISDELEELLALSDRILVLSGGVLRPAPAARSLSPAGLLEAMSLGQAA